MNICYLTEADLSIDNGRGINEREFVDVALDYKDANIVCVAPEPMNPSNYHNENIEYVANHEHTALKYIKYLVDAYRSVTRLHESIGLDGLAVRLDVSPIVPYAVHKTLDLPIALKMLVARQAFSSDVGIPQKPHQLVKRGFRRLFEATIESASCADTPSIVLAEGLRRIFGFGDRDLIVIRNGANLERFSLDNGSVDEAGKGSWNEYNTIIGYAGALAEHRYIALAIRAIALVQDQGGGVALVLVGDGPLRNDLEELAIELGVEGSVFFAGKVPYDRVSAYMRAFDVGLDLSAVPVAYDGPRRLASFSQKGAQYLGCGCPVIAWRLDDTEYISEVGVGRTVEFENVEGLADAFKEVRKWGDGYRDRLQEECRAYARRRLDANKLARTRLKLWERYFRG